MVCNMKQSQQAVLSNGKSCSFTRSAEGTKRRQSSTAKPAPRTNGSVVMAMTIMVVLVFSLDTLLIEWIPSLMASWKFEGNSLPVYLVSIGGGYAFFAFFCYCQSRGSRGMSARGRAKGPNECRTASRTGAASETAPRQAPRQAVQQLQRRAGFCTASLGSGIDGGRAAPGPNSLSLLNHAVSQAATKGDAEKAGHILENLTSKGWESEAASYNIVIRAYAKRGELGRAEQWLAKMRASGISPNEHSYISIMAACAKADNLSTSESWMLRMAEDGVAATCISYAVIIHACARLGKIERAEWWLRRMVEAGVEPDATNYNSLIHACSVQGDVCTAEKWLEEMKAKGLEPTVMTYTALIDACAKALDVHKAEKWLEAMHARGVEPNVVSYSSMINACAKVGSLSRAEHWYREMEARGVEPNAYSYSALINACAQVGDVPAARAWLERAERTGAALDGVVYGCVINACGKVGDAECAMIVFKKMRAHGIKSHIVVYGALARPFAYRGDFASVEGIAEDMRANGIAMNDYFLYTLLLAYSRAKPRQAERAEAAFLSATRAGLAPNDRAGSMPPVSWDKTTTLSGASSLAGNIKSNLKTIPVMVPLYPPGGGSSVVATAEIEIDVLPAQLAAFWVYPYQAETFTVGAQHTLYWTLVNGKEGQAVNFTLTAMEVGQDGSLTPTSWQQPVRASCSVDSTVAVKRYAGGVPACLFAYNMLVPSSLADKQIVLVASWLGGAVLSPHWMVSTPVRFASGRRLNVGKWGTKSLGSVNHTGLRGKAKEKLQKLASHCSAQPLKYKLNAGMNFVEHMKNVILPVGGGMMGGFGERPDWTSKPKPVLNRFGPGHGAGDLSDILPKLLCSGGVCEGMMPGCNRTRVNPLEISKINVQLSRLFRWKKHFGPKMRHMIAYGLALAPSAIQIGQNSAGARRLRMVSAEDPTQHDGTLTNNIEPQHIPRKLKAEHPFATDDGHFAVERDNGEDDEFGDAEFDSFSVQITEPIDYDLTQELLDKFLRRGAFRGISDGREQSHGPVEIVGFKLVKLPRTGPAAPQLLYGVPRPSGEWPEHRSSPGLHSWKYQVTATSVACMALLGALFVMARAAIRRRGYTLVDPPNVLGDARWFA